MTHTTTLATTQDVRDKLRRLTDWLMGRVESGRTFVLSVEEEKRNLEQNAKLHALLTEIAREHEWAGKRRDVETWKRLFVAAWLRARGENIELLPALDGHGVDVVFRRTSKMSKSEVSELIDYIEAWRAHEA